MNRPGAFSVVLCALETRYPDVESTSTVTFNAFNTPRWNNAHVDVQDDHFIIVREIGAAGAVLLDDEWGALPLELGKCGVRSISVICRVLSILYQVQDANNITGNDSGPALRAPKGFRDRVGDYSILAMVSVDIRYRTVPLPRRSTLRHPSSRTLGQENLRNSELEIVFWLGETGKYQWQRALLLNKM